MRDFVFGHSARMAAAREESGAFWNPLLQSSQYAGDSARVGPREGGRPPAVLAGGRTQACPFRRP
jgi:hypothetical protein